MSSGSKQWKDEEGSLPVPPVSREVVWNRTRKRDKGGKRRGKQQPRPSSEWITRQAPELRIISEQLAAAVDARIGREPDRYLRTPDGRLQGRPARHVRYLLSGLARCATCGGGLEVSTRSADKARVYGCATHRRKGPTVRANADVIEMSAADAAVLAVVERALDGELLAAVVDRAAERVSGQRNRRGDLEGQLTTLDAETRRLTSAIASSEQPPASLIDALRARETARQHVERELKACGTTFDRAKLKQALQRHAKDWRALLKRRTENARLILRKFVADRSCSRRTEPAAIT